MKKFQILRYLKRFRVLILLVALLGSAATYIYTDKQLRYTASVVIRYTNSEISDGYTPSGAKLDVGEIYSSAVISQAMNYLGNDGPLNIIRSRCSVDEVISEEQQEINQALLDKGEEVTYFPDTYKVNLVVDGEYGESYARNVLDAIMQSYCTYYTESYVEQRLSLSPSTGLLGGDYDYYECISILEDDTNAMLEFLKAKKDDHPDFRSSKTGYSYSDLYNIYLQFKNYKIPELYARVLDGPQVRDGEVLLHALENSIADSQRQETIQLQRREKLKAIIDNFVEQNITMPGLLEDREGDTVSSDYILGEIYKRGSGSGAQTTYDKLVLDMVDIDKQIYSDQIDRAFRQGILNEFGGLTAKTSGSKPEHESLEQLISDYEQQLGSYYKIVSATGSELNLSISADYLKMISTVRVAPSINRGLYIALALILFLIVGCGGAVVLGRAEEIINYMFYTDKKTGLPNRDRLSIHIDNLSKSILPEDYTCIALRIDNLTEITSRYGYAVGDGILRDFSDIVSNMSDTEGFVGYNGVGSYIAFFEKCGERKAKVILRILDQQIAEYNRINPDYPIRYIAASETTSVSGVYDIRELLRLATAKLESPGAPKADDTGAVEKDGAADDAERASAQTDIPTDGEPSGEPSVDPDISEPTAPADEPTASADEPTASADEPTASADEPTALRAVAAPVKRSQRSIRTHKRRRKARTVYDL